jgi:hypothetical protein
MPLSITGGIGGSHEDLPEVTQGRRMTTVFFEASNLHGVNDCPRSQEYLAGIPVPFPRMFPPECSMKSANGRLNLRESRVFLAREHYLPVSLNQDHCPINE